jgi:hypothetical protein
MPVSPLTQALAGIANVVPCTADFRCFPHIRTLKSPDIRLFVAESFAAGAELVFLAAHDAVLLVEIGGESFGYELAVERIKVRVPVLSWAILELSGEHVSRGNGYAVAVWAAGCAFGERQGLRYEDAAALAEVVGVTYG